MDPTNPIVVVSGEHQYGIDPQSLKPSRPDLIALRLEYQRSLIRSGRRRFTPILVTIDGVIIDGHHAVLAAAEEAVTVDVLVSDLPVKGRQVAILDLPLR